MPSLGDFLHTQFVLKIPKPSASFASKTVIVTGANGGLGKEIVKHIIRLGAGRVIFACRSRSRGDKAKLEIETILKCNPSVIEVWELDLESPSSIKSFVDRANTLPRLDILINNAGIMAINFKVVYDTEHTLAVNNIGTFLLALQLIPKLKETARNHGVTPHMTFVGSALYDVAKYPEKHGDDIFAWFKDGSHFDSMNQYNLSKLLQLYTVIKLSAIVDPVDSTNPNPIVINSLDPCFCKTGLSGGLTGVSKFLFRIFESIAARTAEEGSRLVVQAASAGRQTHGLYLRAGAVQKYAPIAQNDKRATYVWELLCKKLEKLQPGIMQNLQ
ncbi:NAD(P)-binding protein [Pleurostoma richardsiae]|uniref:NAD(P)-binding protein n=1 Tax=Pleurostoma richardsiae TaxID=41990 RepID=A0AA38VN21_9PEZI|nr:NAD(P)-binding protein [Pleurostoma richardsiae]